MNNSFQHRCARCLKIFLEFSTLETLGDKRIAAAMDKYSKNVRLNMSVAPVLEFFGYKDNTVFMAEMTKFLKFALTFSGL